ncbi:hypothetical protein SODALDRAFT_355146 [Sodiomyces alkalinus F11]|uniref:Aflatoxin regulatory protein domain-containing protein n=1 Tax=Sodiomyces alkalinus (strain CBS 110278 / VKM F-3762 / F11) TaxID=1314773 RepID=A0A3N2Q861_SODAK|nr:hypothetical protein SODALDRAFT_355146 [Sodiomyces alkalinus F11]ROT42959.1 hypothetical protein SODALDRAFT_355146 [Sodiomyces alkalinus F11]
MVPGPYEAGEKGKHKPWFILTAELSLWLPAFAFIPSAKKWCNLNLLEKAEEGPSTSRFPKAPITPHTTISSLPTPKTYVYAFAVGRWFNRKNAPSIGCPATRELPSVCDLQNQMFQGKTSMQQMRGQRHNIHKTTPLSPAVLPSMERGSTPEFSLLDSQFGTLDTTMLDSGAHDYLSMLPVDLDFSPIPSYANAMDSSDGSADDALGMSHGRLAAEGYVPYQPDLHFFLSGHDAGAQEETEGNAAGTSECSLPHKQLFQELGSLQSQVLSRQPEGIRMALQLMGQLCCQQDSPLDADLSPLELEYRANTLVDESRVVTDTVNEMLQCAGSDDGYFLAVVCLVMSKVLDAYVKAAQALAARERDGQRSSSSSSSTMSSWSASGTDSASSGSPKMKGKDPKAVQQLLDDLYQVRTSMNHLGAKIVSVCSRRDWLLGGDLTPSSHDSALPALPFSAAILNQLYEELRRRLSAISLLFINELKQFWYPCNGPDTNTCMSKVQNSLFEL